VNFDPEGIIKYLSRAVELRDRLRAEIVSKGGHVPSPGGPATLVLEKTKGGLIVQGKRVGIKSDPSLNPDLHSLHWLLTYGLKGVAAYAYHAYLLGKKDPAVFDFIHRGLAAPLDKSLNVNDFVGLTMKCGEVNIRAMELLDAGNTETYGHPVPTQVPLGVKKGKAILVSGHDLVDLDAILNRARAKEYSSIRMAKCCQHTVTRN